MGMHDTAVPECVSDHVVSSYIPTIRARVVGVIRTSLPYIIGELRFTEGRVPVTEAFVRSVSGTLEASSNRPLRLVERPLESASILEYRLPLTV